jgi:zinc/manganese transport system substrate-binding protein
MNDQLLFFRPGSRMGWRLRRLLAVLVMLTVSAGVSAQESTPLRVVATFSILGDMVQRIAGDRVALTTIVGPNTDAHSFEPTPVHAKALSQAQVVVLNGLDFEGWLPRLLKASGFKGRQILASRGVTPRLLGEEKHGDGKANEAHGHGHASDVDPHAWQSLVNGQIYAQNIADGLSSADPSNKAYYQKRASAYIAEMKLLHEQIKAMLAAVPRERRKVITSHDAFGYFAEAYDVQFISAVGFSSGAEPSARDIAAIVKQARKEGVSALFLENATNPRLVEQIARETGAQTEGTLYPDALAPEHEPAGTYLGMFHWNAGQLIHGLKAASP